nr:PD-(D/E)XK nuclease family protein [Acidimicrobiia bacterium]
MTVTPPAYSRPVPYPVEPVLSPSRVSAFTECALAFRFAKLDGLPEVPSPHAVKGSLVHAALESLFALPAAARTPAAGAAALEQAAVAVAGDPD